VGTRADPDTIVARKIFASLGTESKFSDRPFRILVDALIEAGRVLRKTSLN
jgi:hypothetical protein